MVVDEADLGVANSRLMAGHITMNTLAGPAVGGALFATGMAWPFLVQAVCVGLGVVLLLRISVPVDVRPAQRQRLFRDIVEGLRFRSRGVRIHLGTTARTGRMRVVPLELQGRVGRTYWLGVYAGLVVGRRTAQ